MNILHRFCLSGRAVQVAPRVSLRHSKVVIQSTIPPVDYKITTEGQLGHQDYRLFLKSKDGKNLSPWHDIPLVAGKSETGETIYNFVCEIPRGERWKLEASTKEIWNPIKHDIKKGQVRSVKYSPYLWNYGFLPQTFEDPTMRLTNTEFYGDGDPLDVVEIGMYTKQPGDVVRVKLICCLALIDEGELDWKVIAINIDDPKAQFINSVEDLRVQKPGVLESINDFFINYKIPDGKPQNVMAFNGEVKDLATTKEVVLENNTFYKKLIHPEYVNERKYDLTRALVEK